MALLVAESQSWSAGQWHTTQFVALPALCSSVRGTVTPAAEIRSDPRLACEVFLVFRDSGGNESSGGGCGLSARPEFAADELIPISGHEEGQPPGVLPVTVGEFAYVVEDSPGVEQGPFHQFVAVRFRASFLQDSVITLGVTIEAFDANGDPLEIA